MNKILAGALAAILLGMAAIAGLLQSGTLDFAADEPHPESMTALIAWARERSVARAAAGLTVPDDLSDPQRIRRGSGNYAAMCVECHRSPGVESSEISKGLYPAPPNLAQRAGGADPAGADVRRFWIIKHGIKGSGMPAWSKGGMEDGAIWDMVAFLKVLPDLSPSAYQAQVEASDGHSHAGAEVPHETPAPAEAAAPKRQASPKGHSHAGHSHKH